MSLVFVLPPTQALAGDTCPLSVGCLWGPSPQICVLADSRQPVRWHSIWQGGAGQRRMALALACLAWWISIHASDLLVRGRQRHRIDREEGWASSLMLSPQCILCGCHLAFLSAQPSCLIKEDGGVKMFTERTSKQVESCFSRTTNPITHCIVVWPNFVMSLLQVPKHAASSFCPISGE